MLERKLVVRSSDKWKYVKRMEDSEVVVVVVPADDAASMPGTCEGWKMVQAFLDFNFSSRWSKSQTEPASNYPGQANKAKMAPVKPSTKSKPSSKPSTPTLSKSRKGKSHATKADEVKTKRSSTPAKKKQPVYTDAELGIPKLNGIVPTGIQKPKGKKKGKVFVDDRETTMTIMAMVMAEKDGQIESKMMKARQLEEIREARAKEAEARQNQKKARLEEAKDSLRRRKKRKLDVEASSDVKESEETTKSMGKGKIKKRVSFG
jgi:60S ribosomal subunit assembly/export protein LOC1